jgi:hypothetical protein
VQAVKHLVLRIGVVFAELGELCFQMTRSEGEFSSGRPATPQEELALLNGVVPLVDEEIDRTGAPRWSWWQSVVSLWQRLVQMRLLREPRRT